MQPIKFTRILHGVALFESNALSVIMEVANDNNALNDIVNNCVGHDVICKISDLLSFNDIINGEEDAKNLVAAFSDCIKSLLLTSVENIKFDHLFHSDEKLPKKDLYIFVIRDLLKNKNETVFAVWSSCVELARIVVLDFISKTNPTKKESEMLSGYFDFNSSCVFCVKHSTQHKNGFYYE